MADVGFEVNSRPVQQYTRVSYGRLTYVWKEKDIHIENRYEHIEW